MVAETRWTQSTRLVVGGSLFVGCDLAAGQVVACQKGVLALLMTKRIRCYLGSKTFPF